MRGAPGSRRFPVTVTHLPVTRRQICHRTAPAGPGPSASSWPGSTAGLSRTARPPVPVAGRRAPRCPQMPPSAAAGPGPTCHRAWPQDASGHRPRPIHGDGTHKEPPNWTTGLVSACPSVPRSNGRSVTAVGRRLIGAGEGARRCAVGWGVDRRLHSERSSQMGAVEARFFADLADERAFQARGPRTCRRAGWIDLARESGPRAGGHPVADPLHRDQQRC